MRTITLAMLLALLITPAAALYAQTPDNPLQPEPSPVEETSLAPGAEQVDMTNEQVTEETVAEEQVMDDSVAEDQDIALDSDATMEDDEELPRTASPLALLALLGAAGAGSALSLRSLRRRS